MNSAQSRVFCWQHHGGRNTIIEYMYGHLTYLVIVDLVLSKLDKQGSTVFNSSLVSRPLLREEPGYEAIQ